MKRAWIILLAALFVAPLVFAEEAFFEEASFDSGANTAGDETFFEESGFFAEDGFFGEVAEEAALPEEPAEESAEERTVLATDDKSNEKEYGSVFDGTPVGEPIELLEPDVIDAKPNQVKLEWRHYVLVGYTYKSVKLPKGVAYYVYDQDELSGLWHQVAKTTKRSITLKNQIEGSHRYFVRAEYTKKGYEEYGERSNEKSVFIQDTGLWKSLTKISLSQRNTEYYNSTEVDPILLIRAKDRSEIHLAFTVKFLSGKTISHELPPLNYYKFPVWNKVRVNGGYEYEAEINLNDTSFTEYGTNDVLCRPMSSDWAKSISVQVVTGRWDPINNEYIKGKKSSAKLNKIYYNTDRAKAKPVIEYVYQRGQEYQIRVKLPESGSQAYGIWDGKRHFYHAYYSQDYTIPMDNNAKAGKHKITVAEIEYDSKEHIWKAVGEKATYTLTVPAPAKAPVTMSDFKYDSSKTKITGTLWNSNPKATYFLIEIQDKYGNTITTSPLYVPADASGKATMGGYDDYPFSYSYSSSSGAPFRAIVTTYCYKKGILAQRIISDVYITDDSVIPLKR